MVEIAQKKVKKSKRPSAAHVIEEAEGAENVEASGGVRSEVEVVLIDGAVEEEGGEKRAHVKSLGKVEVAGTEVVVSEEGFVTALSKYHPGVVTRTRLGRLTESVAMGRS